MFMCQSAVKKTTHSPSCYKHSSFGRTICFHVINTNMCITVLKHIWISSRFWQTVWSICFVTLQSEYSVHHSEGASSR